MKLRIANLGAVKEATIDLSRKLTVFCGPNGTGKTWMAYVIYSVINSPARRIVSSKDWEELDARELFEAGEIQLSSDPVLFSTYRSLAMKSTIGFSGNLFALSDEKVSQFLSDFDIKPIEEEEDYAKIYEANPIAFRVNFLGGKFTVTKAKNTTDLKISLDAEDILAKRGLYERFHFGLFAPQIIHQMALYPISESVFLPVERNSITTFSKELSLKKQSLVDQLQDLAAKGSKNDKELGRLVREIPRYTMPVREALVTAEDIAEISKRKSHYYDFAMDIEQDILKGEISVSDEGEVLFAPDNAKDKKLSFHISSASVKTITSLVLYLKHQAKENDLIIIDEPELNLHPDNQILLARVFARMINQGLRLLISTHSDYIVRELNNLIMLSSDEPALKKVAQDYGYREDEKIDKSDIGVYLFNFKDGSEQVVVEPVEVADNGFEVATIEDTINRLNAVSEDLFYYMKHGHKHREAEQA